MMAIFPNQDTTAYTAGWTLAFFRGGYQEVTIYDCKPLYFFMQYTQIGKWGYLLHLCIYGYDV